MKPYKFHHIFSQYTYRFGIRPFQNSWMFFIFAETLYFISQFTENVNGWQNFGAKTLFLITLYSIADIALLSYLIGLFSKKFAEWVSLAIITVLSASAFTEIFIFRQFSTLYNLNIVQIIEETNASECGGFIKSYVLSPLGFGCIIGFIIYNIFFYISQNWSYRVNIGFNQLYKAKKAILILSQSIIILCAVFTASILYWQHTHTRYDMAFLTPNQPIAADCVSPYVITYRPIIRLGCALYNNRIIKTFALPYIRELQEDKYNVKTFTPRSPFIVVIIGESCIYKHMSIYGYKHETTPCQSKAVEDGDLMIFKDMVSPSCYTSEVLKNIFTVCSEEDGNIWAEHPFYIAYFKKAGYQTALLSNQYIVNKNIKEDDLSGPLLSNPTINKSLFDYRNWGGHKYDEGLIDDWHNIKDSIFSQDKNLIFFHVMGQHFDFRDRFPADKVVFTLDDYKYRTMLGNKEKQIVADYDNAILYGDYVIGGILKELENKDALVIFLSDHGEEVYDDDKTYGRQHNTTNKALIDNEFHIPFWIWTSDTYKNNHKEMFEQIKASSSNPYITDDFPHTLLYLAGIDCEGYDETRAIMSPKFNKSRIRRLHSKNIHNVDYDKAINGAN